MGINLTCSLILDCIYTNIQFFLSVLTIARKRLVQEGRSVSIEIGGSVLTGSDVTRIFLINYAMKRK